MAQAKLGSGGRFKKLEGQLAAKGAHDPGALAAWIGRKRYGNKKFANLSNHGHDSAKAADTKAKHQG